MTGVTIDPMDESDPPVLVLTRHKQDPENKDNFGGWIIAELVPSFNSIGEVFDRYNEALDREEIEAYTLVDTTIKYTKGMGAHGPI